MRLTDGVTVMVLLQVDITSDNEDVAAAAYADGAVADNADVAAAALCRWCCFSRHYFR